MLQQETGAQVIITGMNPPSVDGDKHIIGNMYLDGSKTFYRSIPSNGKSYSGTGDLFAAIIMGSLMRGEDLEKSIQLAMSFLKEAINDSSLKQIPEIEGVNFEKHLRMLL